MTLPSPRPLLASRTGALLLTCTALALPAAAQVLPDTLARAAELATQAATATAPPGARVLASPGALDPRLSLAPCQRIDVYLASGVPVWGRTRVGLRCGQGAVRWNVFLPMTVQVWAPALVSSGALPAGAKLTEGQLVLADTDWAAATQPPFAKADVLAGRTLTRAVAAGQALRASDLQSRQWFALGDTVQVRVTGGGFSINAEGRAMTPGVEGQEARVRIGQNRVVVGRPVGERRLEIEL